VRDGNRGHQGQPEPAAGIAGPLPPGEPLERARRHVIGEPAALIGDVQAEQLAIVASLAAGWDFEDWERRRAAEKDPA
jgi:hypothetical protein